MERFQLLTSNAFVVSITRYFTLQAIIGECVIVGLFAAGVMAWPEAVAVGAVPPFFSVAVIWLARSSGQGAAELQAGGLVVRTRAVTHSYLWRHVLDIEVITLGDTGLLNSLFYRLLGIHLAHRLVRLKLRRWFRLGLGRVGTDVLGLPVPVMNLVYLFFDDPEAFVKAAAPYVKASGPHTP